MSTFKSSGYRSWSTRTFNHPEQNPQDTPTSRDTTGSRDTFRSYDLTQSQISPPHDRSRSHDISEEQENPRKHLRLHLVNNSAGFLQLDLSSYNFIAIPMEVFLFSRLEVLKLSNNHLTEIPLAIARLRSLKFLYLEENCLTFLPETISNCTNTIEINLTRNKLSTLPTNIGMMRNLRVLRMGQNNFECLPHEIGQLENLRYLDVHGNRIWYLPFSVCKLHKLKYLNLSNNRFEHLPLPVCRITALRTLTLRGNHLMNLLPDFDNLNNLKELNLSYNKFETIPQAIFRLRSMMYLNMNGNQLEKVPNTIMSLKSLKVLHVQGNRIESLPSTLPMNLQYLNVAHNKLYNFSVANMHNLKSLNANNNRLENLPMGVYSLYRIQTLRFNTNQISYVSPDIAGLKKLRTFDLGNNTLVNIPQVLHQLDKLDFFNVKGNSIQDKIMTNARHVHQTDSKRKRRFQSNPRAIDSAKRHFTTRSHHRKRKSKYKYAASQSGNSTLTSIQDAPHKMWDSEDLLENGFSARHIFSNSNSAYLSRKTHNRYRNNEAEDEIFSFSTLSRISAHEMALTSGSDDISETDFPVQTTDYRLLGICNQVEMLLNKQLLHPVLSLKGHDTGKSFSEKAIVKTASGLWRISDDKNDNVPPGLVATTTETFTVTPQGGWLTSSHDNNISIYLPSKAVSTLTQARMKILKVEPDKLLQLRRDNRMISNILDLGPIVYLKNLQDTDFNHQVTITIPAPVSERHGHLHLLTIRDDNSCIPSSSGYQNRSRYVVLRAWNLAGKAAVLTRAKCKYKACKSMELLLMELGRAASSVVES